MAVNKLFDLFEQWFGGILNKNLKDKATDKISDAATNLETITNAIDDLNEVLIDQKQHLRDAIRQHGSYSAQVEKIRKDIKQTERELNEENDKRKKILKNLAKETNLSIDELEDLIQQIKLYGKEAVKSGLATNSFRNIMGKATAALGFDLKALSAEFFSFASIIAFATEQLVKSNQYLVEFARRSGGVLNYNRLGFSPYGVNTTSNVGSLSALADVNNVSEEQIFEALQGFRRGNILGQDLSKGAADLQKFAVQQARLIKLYGVAGSDIEKITEASTQLYNVSIKELNKVFADGSKTARQAGLNVQEYFRNLARAAELIGQIYIRGGTEGMGKLAMFATRFNASVDTLVKFGQGFETIGSIFEKQAQATNLGLRTFAANSQKIFAQYQLGNQQGAAQTAIVSLAKDLRKYTDRFGAIDFRGIRALQQLGYGQDQIQVIQRTIQAQRKLGVSFEELSDISKLSTQKQIQYYAEMNRSAKIQEKLNKLWGQFKSVLLDPIVAILGPTLDLTINLLIAAFQGLYFILKPVLSSFQQIGKVISNVSDKVAGVTGFIEERLKGLGVSGEGISKTFEKIIDIGGTLIAAFITFRAATYAAAAAQRFSGNISNVFNNLPLGGRTKALGRLARMRLGQTGLGRTVTGLGGLLGKIGPRALRGSAIGIAGGLVGDAISSFGEEGSTVNRVGGVVSGAATGAGIGMIGGPWGALAGGIIGGLIGAFKPDELHSFMKKAVYWLGRIFDPLNILKGLWERFIGDTKKDENLKLASQTFDNSDIFRKVNDTLNSRIVDAFKAEKAQERLIQQQAKPVIHVETGLLGGAKVKASGY